MDGAIYVQSLHSITIGRRDDNLTNEVRIDCASWLEKYPYLTTYRIEYTNSLNQKNIALDVELQDSTLVWTITNQDTSVEGEGLYQIIATGKNGEQKASREAALYVRPRIHGDGQEESLEYMKPLLDQMAEYAQRAEDAAEKAESTGGGTSFDVDETLKLENGILFVNTANVVEADNTLPVTSAAVQTTVGNINALLETI